ncbi:MAG TPA: LLM class F420-dependent oxidoreductase [Methylomirabilota bacterium]|nr:LLM class F420-dependent oxidoreductase [Methylomirabilota bacterium]
MGQKRWSLSVPIEGFTLPELAELGREAEGLGYTDAWSYEVDGADGFTPLAVIAQSSGLRVGTAIANVYTRGPATLASTAASLAELAPGRFVLGIGSGSQLIVEAWNGDRFVKPATRVREMAQVLRAALAGERVVFKGETLAVDGFRLTRVPSRPVPIYIAALRPGMLRVAGEVGDGVILNWGSPEDVPKSLAVVRETARKAGRDPDAIEVTARLFLSIDPPGGESDLMVRRHIAAYMNVPVYRAYQEWLGRTEALTPMWSAWAAGDRKGAVAAIPERVIDELIGRGPLEAIRKRVQRYMDNGLDTAFLSLMTTETDPERKRTLLRQAIHALAPSA